MIPTGFFKQGRKIIGLIGRRYWAWVAILMVTTVASSFLEVLGITAILPIFKIMLDPGHVAHMGWIRQVFGDISPSNFFLLVCGAVLILFVVKGVATLFSSWLKLRIQAWLYQDLSSRLLNSYLDSPISFHLRHGPSELLRNLNSYVAQTTQYGFLGLVDLTSDTLLAIGIFSALMWVQPVVSLLAVFALGTIAGIYVVVGQPYFLQLSRRYKAASARVFQTATESLVGIKTLKTLGCETYFEEIYRRCISEFCDTLRKNAFVGVVPRQVLELFAVAALIGLMAWAVLEGRDPATLIPVLAVFAAATIRIIPAIVRITATLQSMRFGHEAVEVVYAGIMRSRAMTTARPAARFKAFSGDIQLKDVTFFYEGVGRPALDKITLEIRNGEAVAFVGLSGAGKTTLADLILGLHKPDSGLLSINGVCYADPARIPRGSFGYVPQEPFLIDDTIRRNVALGITEEAVDEERFAKAIKNAALDDFISSLPEGSQTLVGDRGVRLSGGQRQRIGIARAMYVDPDVLVLDEATSSIDLTTESEIADAISRLHGTKTLIIVAHRLSTIRECDRIFYLDSGRVVDSGRYDELIRKNAGFAAMVRQMDKSSQLQAVSR